MHSGGFELTKLTYTRVEDDLIRHRGDRQHSTTTLLRCACTNCFFAAVFFSRFDFGRMRASGFVSCSNITRYAVHSQQAHAAVNTACPGILYLVFNKADITAFASSWRAVAGRFLPLRLRGTQKTRRYIVTFSRTLGPVGACGACSGF